jgi:2-polyprenyl-3-methyl-5-hydroxy-6-metoxy-1,4-benzoquinol methylase
MLSASDVAHYQSVGESALTVISACLALARFSGEPRSILDFGCGSGRVLRWLRAAYPNASIHASDVRDDSLRFCAAQFGATAWRSHPNLAGVEAPAKYDLIWSGSLATHLSEESTRILLRKLWSWLSADGICIVTTHGRKALRNMRTRKARYIPVERHEDVLFPLNERGYGYLQFQGRDVGFSVTRLDWLLRESLCLDARIVCIAENAWDNHQDIIALQRI